MYLHRVTPKTEEKNTLILPIMYLHTETPKTELNTPCQHSKAFLLHYGTRK